MSIDFFKDGNELKQKTKEELIKEINDIKIKNEKMVDEIKEKEALYIHNNINRVTHFLTKELSFVLTTEKDCEYIYKFMKDSEEYSINISSSFINYNKPRKRVTYAFCVSYKNNHSYLETLKTYEDYRQHASYLHHNKDISEYFKEYNTSKNILDDNIKLYNEIKELHLEKLFVLKVKESCASITRSEKDCKEYNYLVDFIKEIL